jgi:hypothetical protein
MALRDLRALLQMTPMPYWAMPTLIGLGLASRMDEIADRVARDRTNAARERDQHP